MTLVHLRTLKMTDDILSVRYSPDNKFLAVALLDSTVKVFYQDTLKFFLSLYGHKVCPFSHVKPLNFSFLSLASGARDGYIVRFEINCYLFSRQERQNMGFGFRGLSQVDLRS